jgi:hypothetical protein
MSADQSNSSSAIVRMHIQDPKLRNRWNEIMFNRVLSQSPLTTRDRPQASRALGYKRLYYWTKHVLRLLNEKRTAIASAEILQVIETSKQTFLFVRGGSPQIVSIFRFHHSATAHGHGHALDPRARSTMFPRCFVSTSKFGSQSIDSIGCYTLHAFYAFPNPLIHSQTSS